MIKSEEKSRTLNFQRFHFLMEFSWKVTFNTVSLKWKTYFMALFLVREATEFPTVLRSDTQSVYCNVAWDKLAKLSFVDSLYAFKSSNFNDFILRKR